MPAYSYSIGSEVADLMALAGRPLDEWQKLCVTDILAIGDGGRWCATETCTIVPRQNGKGGIIEALKLAGLFILHEPMILYSAHEYRTAQEAFIRIRDLIDGSDELRREIRTIREANGEQQIVHRSGARLRYIARSKGAGRGFSGQRILLDEAFAVVRAQLAALLPTMAAQPNPQLNMFSTPLDLEMMPANPEDAVLLNVRRRAREAIESGNPGRLCYHEWGPPDDFIPTPESVSDRELWYATNPALGIRIGESYMEDALASMGPEKFAVEQLGWWPEQRLVRWQVLTEAQWRACQDASSAPEDPIVFGIAVHRDGSRAVSCIGLAGRRVDGDLHIEVPQLDHRPGTGWVVERAKELQERWNPPAWVVDPGSPAGVLVPDLEAAGLPVVKLSSRNVAQAYGLLIDGLTAQPGDMIELEDGRMVPVRRVWHRDDPRLATAMSAARTRRVGADGYTWDTRDTDLTPLLAVGNALWGLLTLPALAPAVPFFAAWR